METEYNENLFSSTNAHGEERRRQRYLPTVVASSYSCNHGHRDSHVLKEVSMTYCL